MVYTKYYDKSFLSDIQDLEDISGFSFKKISNQSNSKYVFGCSHIEKYFEDEEMKCIEFNEYCDWNETNFFCQNIMEFDEISEKTFIFPKIEKKKIKRCKFKIVFKKIDGLFTLSKNSVFYHCHEPKKIYNKYNQLYYRNIKLSYDFVLKYFKKLCNFSIKYKNDIDIINLNLKKKKKKYINKYLSVNTKNNINMNRKIVNFLKSIKNILNKIVNVNNIEKNFSIKEFIKLFLKQNANSYLRFEDIEKLNDYIK
jgi:hypothetical protein